MATSNTSVHCRVDIHVCTLEHTIHACLIIVSLQKLYLAFVSNCKFTSAKSLPQICFMENCLVELLSVDPTTSYQHAFVYIRQLAIHLRTALTSAKKQAVQVEEIKAISTVSLILQCYYEGKGVSSQKVFFNIQDGCPVA